MKAESNFIQESTGLEFAPRRLFVEIVTPPIFILVQDQACAELRGVISPRASGRFVPNAVGKANSFAEMLLKHNSDFSTSAVGPIPILRTYLK
jgi:hypothetical protein